MFSIKKCGAESCKWCKKPKLPDDVFSQLHHLPDPVPGSQDDHYQDFESLYGSNTSEKFRPSLLQQEEKGHGMPFSPSAQYAKNVGVVIQCNECQRWRVIYSKTVLSREERNELEEITESLIYTCGSTLQNIQGTATGLLEKIYVKRNLTCTSFTEIPYYSAKYEDICYYCGTTDELATSSSHYPICSFCKQQNKDVIARRKRKFGPTTS